MAVADFESSDEQLQTFQHTSFAKDHLVLESLEFNELPLDTLAELPPAVDRISMAYRCYLKQLGTNFVLMLKIFNM